MNEALRNYALLILFVFAADPTEAARSLLYCDDQWLEPIQIELTSADGVRFTGQLQPIHTCKRDKSEIPDRSVRALVGGVFMSLALSPCVGGPFCVLSRTVFPDSPIAECVSFFGGASLVGLAVNGIYYASRWTGIPLAEEKPMVFVLRYAHSDEPVPRSVSSLFRRLSKIYGRTLFELIKRDFFSIGNSADLSDLLRPVPAEPEIDEESPASANTQGHFTAEKRLRRAVGGVSDESERGRYRAGPPLPRRSVQEEEDPELVHSIIVDGNLVIRNPHRPKPPPEFGIVLEETSTGFEGKVWVSDGTELDLNRLRHRRSLPKDPWVKCAELLFHLWPWNRDKFLVVE